MLPFISSLKDIEQTIVNTSTNATAVAQSKTKILQLEEAQKGWQSVIDRNDFLYASARAGKLRAVTQLVADALLRDQQGVDNVKYMNGTLAPGGGPALRSVSAIRYSFKSKVALCFRSLLVLLFRSFGGYGASISYSESTSTDLSHSNSFNADFTATASLDLDIQLLMFSIGPHIKFKLTLGGGFSKTMSDQSGESVSRTRGFSLSDGDEYDVFDVQVFHLLYSWTCWRTQFFLVHLLLCRYSWTNSITHMCSTP